MKLNDLKDKKIIILGFGQEGMACARFLSSEGFSYSVADKSELGKLPVDAQNFIQKNSVHFFGGEDYLNSLNNFDVAFRSPGLWLKTPALVDFKENGGLITSQTKWFFENTQAKIIGVTGTKGKGTTSSLIFEFIKEAILKKQFSAFIKPQSKVFLTGNIGQEQPLDFLNSLSHNDVVVYELSSFQLQDLEASPHIAVMLMVTEDHLDTHADLTEYHEAKYNLLKYQNAQDYAIVNFDYPFSANGAKFTQAKILRVGVTEGSNAFITDGTVTVSINSEPGLVIKLSDLKIRGQHNLENVGAATLVALLAGIPKETITQVLQSFEGLPHRLKLVGSFWGVKFYDDSFATNPDPTIAAIKSFSEPIHLILGGSDKKADFSSLGQALSKLKNLKSITILGVTGPKILEAFYTSGGSRDLPVIKDFTNFDDIFSSLKPMFQEGDSVLLSPASASFGLFENYKDRGNKFAEAVQRLN